MPSETIAHLLDRLEELKRPSSIRHRARLAGVLSKLGRRRFKTTEELIRFHEALLFLRAYPQTRQLLHDAEALLRTFQHRVKSVCDAHDETNAFSEPEVSGIAGTSLTAIFSYPIARWLARRFPLEVTIDWEGYEDSARLGETLPRFIPLLDEESLVEANIPFTAWLREARGKGQRELTWLIQRFESHPCSEREKTELYDSLRLYIHWSPRHSRATRTKLKMKTRGVFYHNGPLISRREISLALEMDSPPLPVKRLSQLEGAKLLDTIRETSAVRYRELHGFTHGDPKRVTRADAGRGVEFFINGVNPENRLPLRAYHSVFMVKNGVPVGYVEGLSFFERMEIGFNIYYTFRDGESAWLYARILRLFRQLLGVTVFSVDPYQIGFENEEGIESGAFWFYRKLGFRPVVDAISLQVALEEKKMATRPGFRTSTNKLRQLAAGHMLFEFKPDTPRRWDRFQVRNLGLAVTKEMGKRFRGDVSRMRSAANNFVSRSLGINPGLWNQNEQRVFENLSLVLSLIPGLSRWTPAEKRDVVSIIRAKAGAEESKYLRLLQGHHRLRNEVIRLGS